MQKGGKWKILKSMCDVDKRRLGHCQARNIERISNFGGLCCICYLNGEHVFAASVREFQGVVLCSLIRRFVYKSLL